MVSNDVRYDSSYIFIEGLYVLDEDSCKQRCISTTECAVIVYYTNNFCLLYNATQYSNGTADSSSTTFLKSCARTFCTLNTFVAFQYIYIQASLCLSVFLSLKLGF